MTAKPSSVVMEEVTDPEELAKARAQRERFDRNSAWLQAHVSEIYSRHRGKCICIAGEELFVADTPSVYSQRKACLYLCALKVKKHWKKVPKAADHPEKVLHALLQDA